MINIKCKLKDSTVSLPKYETKGAAGMDLTAHTYVLPTNLKEELEFPLRLYPNQRVLIKTGVFIELPEEYEAQIRPRSGLAIKNGITIVNSPGTIDEDYRGEIGVILLNTGDDIFTINKGDRIAQMVFNKVEKGNLILETELSDTERSAGGFGSTNI
jgi:dUTP pyrophosphatase